jgi:hypothetical protein
MENGTTKIRRDVWNTYKTEGYTYDVADDQRSAGGVHCHQVRKAAGGWQKRVLQVNHPYRAASEVYPLSAEEGEAAFREAAGRP